MKEHASCSRKCSEQEQEQKFCWFSQTRTEREQKIFWTPRTRTEQEPNKYACWNKVTKYSRWINIIPRLTVPGDIIYLFPSPDSVLLKHKVF